MLLRDILKDIEKQLDKQFSGYKKQSYVAMIGETLNIDASRLPSYTYRVKSLSNIQKKGASFDIFQKTLNYHLVIVDSISMDSTEMDIEMGIDTNKADLNDKSRDMIGSLFERVWELEAYLIDNNGEYFKGITWNGDIKVDIHQNKYVLVSGSIGINIEHDPREVAVGSELNCDVVFVGTN